MAPDLSAYGLRAVYASKLHARLLGRTCRDDDRAAILSQGKWQDAERCARANLNRSAEAWAIYRESDFAFLGVVGVMCFQRTSERQGYQHPWWMLTPVAEDPALLSAARALAESFRDRYPLLIATVRASDGRASEALQAIGFTLMAPAKFGSSPDLWCKAVLDTRKVEVAHG